MRDLHTSALTLAVGALGAAIAWAIHMPLAFLGGPALAVAFAGMAGLSVGITRILRDAAFLLVGLNIGSMVTPDSLAAMVRWPIAFALLAGLTMLTPYVGRWFLSRRAGFDRDEAFLASSPGHLSLVIALAESLSLSVSRPAILASIRVLALTLLVPLAARLAGLDIGPGLPARPLTMGWVAIAVQVAAALVLIPVLIRLRLPAPPLLAGMMVGAGTHLPDLVQGTLPEWVSQLLLVLMGSLIGSRFLGIGWDELRSNLAAGAGIVLMATGLAVVFALPAAWLAGLPVLDVLVGFAPGGLETMVIVGVALGADPGFVAAAHVFRLILLAAILAAYATRMAKR